MIKINLIFAVLYNLMEKSKHSFPNGNACFLHYTEGDAFKKARLFSQPSNILYNMKTNQRYLIVAIEVEVIRLVKVCAYKRVRFGKVERVRSHYRSY